ncbi:ATP-binding protein [Flavobacterium sediminilitoris]|uniref:ATP-binding protein n=1 Tax=Flavobacterium sediminilitoris TaxID=2024526 RepID=A0ABY4HN66_9FLAO|nr:MULTISPECIES: ATP-binding protein [Flavobacterium]UOX34302.1 ATP-binding protein [Flavobacterium sediminilitoris]
MNVYDLIITDKKQMDWDNVLMDVQNRESINQLLKEYKYAEQLMSFDLPINNKILLHGSSGCGKTTTAKAIAKALGKNLYILDLSNIISSRIGETSQNLRKVFDKVKYENAVLFLDEFDQIGKMRGKDDKDVGEMRRLVNTLIQLIDYFPEKSVLIAATNQLEIIDKAVIRRFQCIIEYRMPNKKELNKYYDLLLLRFPDNLRKVQRKYKISYAEAKDYTYTIIKSIVIKEIENNYKL